MFWTSIFALLAVLFNPVIPIYLTKKIWVVLDLGAATVIGVHFVFIRGIRAKARAEIGSNGHAS